MTKYVAYYRVSTKGQGQSGLGLAAQKAAVTRYLSGYNTEPIQEFEEIESGANDNRPKLESAIQACEATGATLLIADLSRLTRNVSFGFQLKDRFERSSIQFKALSHPVNDTLTFGIYLSMIQDERERISRRTKAALQALKAQGVDLGNPENLNEEARAKGQAVIKQNARKAKANRHAFHFIKPKREQGLSYGKIAEALNAEGYKTRNGKKFHSAQVMRIYKRFNQATRPELINAAQELNTVMGLEPPIDTEADKAALIAQLKEATQIIMESDEISDATEQTLRSL